MKCPECDIGEMIPTSKHKFCKIWNRCIPYFEHKCNNCDYSFWVIDELLIGAETELEPISKEELKSREANLPTINIDAHRFINLMKERKQ